MSTSSTALQQYQAEVVINNDTGASFLSLSALARVCNTHKETVKRTVTLYPSKMAEVLTATGLKTVTLFAEDAIAHAIVKHNPELVKPVHDARYSSVNSYHEQVLKHVLGF